MMTLNGSATNPVAIVSPSNTLLPMINRLVISAESIIASSQSSDSQRFDLGSEFAPVVEEAKRLYQMEKKISEVPRVSSYLAVLRNTSWVGRIHDAMVVPLESEQKTSITVRNDSGSKTEVGWLWTNILFTDHLTYIDIAEGERVGAVVVHFPRQQ
ncbi:hypothetical protein BDW69DRAFT_50405 [Aspergillus filifer]